MKVLFINTVYEHGSTGRIVADLGKTLEEHGHEFKVAYGRGEKRHDFHCYRVGSDYDMYIHAGLSRITDKSGFYSRTATKKLIEFINSYVPDIIHLHNLHGYYVNLELLFQYIKAKDIPVVWTFHDCWPYTGHCVHYDSVNCMRWQTGCYNCPNKNEYPQSMLLDASARNYTHKKAIFSGVNHLTIVTVSDWLKSQVAMSFLKDYNTVRIYNGIDMDVFRPLVSDIKKRLGIEGKKLLLGVSDTWTERKGLNYFYRYAEEKEPGEALVMVGFKKGELSKVPRGIIPISKTDNVQELVELYSAADIVLNPSQEETFGLVTVEALSCGTPVIVQNATACPELVDDTCGRVFEKGDYKGMKRAIAEVYRQHITERDCLKHAEIFDKKKNYEQYISLYEKILREA